MKTNWESGGIVPRVLYLGASWGEWLGSRPNQFFFSFPEMNVVNYVSSRSFRSLFALFIVQYCHAR